MNRHLYVQNQGVLICHKNIIFTHKLISYLLLKTGVKLLCLNISVIQIQIRIRFAYVEFNEYTFKAKNHTARILSP